MVVSFIGNFTTFLHVLGKLLLFFGSTEYDAFPKKKTENSIIAFSAETMEDCRNEILFMEFEEILFL